MKKVVLSLAVITFPSFAVADHHDEGKGMHTDKEAVSEMFKKSDSDNNGKVSKEEFLKQATEKFQSYDENGDGSLSEEEHESMAAHKHKKLMKKSD